MHREEGTPGWVILVQDSPAELFTPHGRGCVPTGVLIQEVDGACLLSYLPAYNKKGS